MLAHGIAGLADGVHHYRAEDHALERRAAWPSAVGPSGLYLGQSSVIWREVWKYGERDRPPPDVPLADHRRGGRRDGGGGQ